MNPFEELSPWNDAKPAEANERIATSKADWTLDHRIRVGTNRANPLDMDQSFLWKLGLTVLAHTIEVS